MRIICCRAIYMLLSGVQQKVKEVQKMNAQVHGTKSLECMILKKMNIIFKYVSNVLCSAVQCS